LLIAKSFNGFNSVALPKNSQYQTNKQTINQTINQSTQTMKHNATQWTSKLRTTSKLYKNKQSE